MSKVLNKSIKSIKKVLQVLTYVRKSPAAENSYHAENSLSSYNVSNLTSCNKMRAESQKRPHNRPDCHKYLLFRNIN